MSFVPQGALLALLAAILHCAMTSPVWMPQFLSGGSGRNIRNLPCVSRRTGETGVCMFAFTCMKANGTHLGTCIERFYFGSCCKLPEDEVSTISNTEDNNLFPLSTTTESKYHLSTFQTVQDNDNRVEIDDNQTIKPVKPLVIPTKKPSIPEKKPISNPTTIKSTTPKSTTADTHIPDKPYIKPNVTSPLSSPKPTIKPTQIIQIVSETKPTKPPKTTTRKPSIQMTISDIPAPSVTTTKSTTQATPSATTTRKPVSQTKPSEITKIPSTQTRPTVITTRKPATTETTHLVTQQTKTTTVKPSVQTTAPTTRQPTKPIETTPGNVDIYTETTTKRPITQASTYQTSTLKPISHIGPPSTTTKKPVFQTKPTSTTTRKPPLTTKRPETTSRAPVTRPKPPPTTTKKPSTTESTTKPKPTVTTTTKKPLITTTSRKPPTKKPTKTTERPTETTTTAPASLITWTSIQEPPKTEAATTITTTVDWILVPVTTHPPSTDSTQQTGTTTSTYPDTIPDVSTATITSRPETTLEPEVTNIVPNATLDIDLNMTDFRQVCGRRLFPESRIVGGEKASFGKWPWQISLRQWRTSTYLHKCGAALLNENWAITAAHCVENVPPSDLLLRLGEHDLSSEEEPYGYQERRVQIVASHPQFDPRTFEYDLALLRFYEPVTFQPNILPVCVPHDDTNFVGHTAYVTGWGRLYEDGPLPSVLQEVSVPVINNSVCETMYRSAGYIEHIPDIFICAGWKKGGFDSCEGDSGGPMVIQRPDKRWLLAGVISWGIGCAEPNQPGVYTRISEFREWINQILQF